MELLYHMVHFTSSEIIYRVSIHISLYLLTKLFLHYALFSSLWPYFVSLSQNQASKQSYLQISPVLSLFFHFKFTQTVKYTQYYYSSTYSLTNTLYIVYHFMYVFYMLPHNQTRTYHASTHSFIGNLTLL